MITIGTGSAVNIVFMSGPIVFYWFSIIEVTFVVFLLFWALFLSGDY